MEAEPLTTENLNYYRKRGNAAILNQAAMKRIQKIKPNSHPAEARVLPATTQVASAETAQENP